MPNRYLLGLVLAALANASLMVPVKAGALGACPSADGSHFIVSVPEDSGPGSLRGALNDATTADGGVICVLHDVATISLSAGLSYSGAGSLELDGNGVAIVGNDTFGLLVTAGPLTVNDVSMSGGHALAGGAIKATNDLLVNRSTFTDNKAEGTGGAIDSETFLRTVDSLFEHNSAASTGGTGGAVSSLAGWIDIAYTTFRSNSSWAAGAIYSNNVVNVSGSRFLENSADLVAGINANSVEISTSEFARNSALAYGGIAAGTVSITDSEFVENTGDVGGAVAVGTSGTVTRSTFSDNRAPNSEGGAVHSQGPLTITGSTFADNSARLGGAIDGFGLVTAINSTFTGNDAAERAGAIAAGPISSIYSTFSNNTSPDASALYGFGTAPIKLFGTVLVKRDGTGALCNGEVGGQSLGYNFANESPDSCHLTATGDTTAAGNDAGLSALGDFGGPTRTMLPGTELIDRIPASDCNLAEPVFLVFVSADQRGFPRPALPSSRCDIGAAEVQPSTPDVPPERERQSPPAILLEPRFTG